MPTFSQRTTRKYRVIVSEYQTWTEYATSEEMKAPRAQGDSTPPAQVDKEEWIETDQIETGRKAVIASYLRGLADELHPQKDVLRSREEY